jgi:hypothetical protein
MHKDIKSLKELNAESFWNIPSRRLEYSIILYQYRSGSLPKIEALSLVWRRL